MNRKKFLGIILLSPVVYTLSTSMKMVYEAMKAVVVKAKESRFGVQTPFLGVNPNDLKLSSKDTNGRLSTFYYKGVQKVGPMLHYHLYQDEVFYVIEGEYVFQLGNEKQLLHSGDLIFLPRNIPHCWVQISGEGEMFYFLQPAGKMEEFFLRMTEIGAGGTDQERAKIGEDAGIVNAGPGLEATYNHIFTDKLTNGFVVSAGASRSGEKILINRDSPNDVKVSGKDTRGELSIFEYLGEEKGGPPLHVHPNQDETFYITDGEYLFQCGDEKVTLKKGDMIFLPRGVPHTWAQLTGAGKLIYFFQPAGRMEDFFRTIGNQKSDLTPEEGNKLWEDHEMKIVGPPLAF